MTYTLITGASCGLGAELAKLFARDRSNLILCSCPYSRSTLTTLAEELRQEHDVKVYSLSVDLCKPAAGKYLIQMVKTLGIQIDTLVNNAGAAITGSRFQDYEPQQFSAMLHLNVLALSELTMHFVPEMVRRGCGRVLNVSLVPGQTTSQGLDVGYAASKAYVASLSETLSNDLRQTGVTCTHLMLGPTGFQPVVGADHADEHYADNLELINLARAAKAGYDAMNNGQSSAIPGRPNRAMNWLTRLSAASSLGSGMSNRVAFRNRD